jgi:DNA-binding response OmpR family regulator|tara:strand:- start:98 stop:472 length:375 start_codon:yes stop_codon:yes gene_type:complete
MESKKILIIEDEESIRHALSEVLKEDGFEVLEAENGKLGLESAIKNHPDLILLDILMPVIDGITMLKTLRADKWGIDAKIMLLTNVTDDKQIADAVLYGVYDYLTKSSWELTDVVKKIKEKLDT